jgi:hypothetical protein
MSDLFDRAIQKARMLPEAEKNVIAAIILEELEDDARGKKAFSKSQGALAKLAEKAMEEDRKGQTKELDPDLL